MDNLSENNIKRAALGFLKSYYRYRQRLGETTLRLNMRAEGGIIIDGYLSFRESEEKLFTATVEATSLLTKEEIRYKVNKALLTWDSVAAGMVVTTIFFALGHFRELFSVPQMGGALLWSFLLAFSIFLFHAIYRLFFSKLRRYRYIYAVEQFKRYFADEQWIAIGENVFPDPEDPYFLELREQCIYNGFGLLVVDGELRPKVHITPSRVDLFSSGRKILEFFSLDELARRLQSSAVAVPLWDRLLRRLRGMDVKKPQEKLLRFQKSYLHQKAICLISFFLLAAMFSREMEEGPLEYVDEGEYQEKMILEKQAADREPLGYLVDSSAVRPFLKQSEPYLIQKEPLPAPADQYGPASQRPGLIVHRRGDRFFEYGCERLYEKVGPQFVIAVELFDEITPLKELIRRFNEKGLNAMGLWLGCFTYQEDDFVLFLDQLYASREEAVRDAGDWQKRLESEGFSAKLEILSLQKNY